MSENPQLPSHPVTSAPAPPVQPAPPVAPHPQAYPAAPTYAQPPYPQHPGYTHPAYPSHPGYTQPTAQTAGAPAVSRTLGVIALIVAIVGVVVSLVGAGVAGSAIGAGVGEAFANSVPGAPLDAHIFSPVRDWVLVGEISFWAGTILGTWALVQGVIAIAARRGLGQGIAAVVIAALGPVVYFVALAVMFSTGSVAAFV